MDRAVNNEPMPRPTEFDTERALDRALLLFWRKGYQATSLADLTEAMGIGRGSFYAAFGDKRALFEACLDRFARRTQAILLEAMRERAPLDGLQWFLERHLHGHDPRSASLGCLLVNTVLELAGVDDALGERASRHLSDVQTLFESGLARAGCAPERARELAALLMRLNEGVRVASRRRLAVPAQREPIEAAFRLIRTQVPAAVGYRG
jgi:TetR/AcrR family transcriptional repressor of nem operon